MPYLDQDQIRFHYELSGEGPTVVFCHGLTGCLDDCKQLVGSLPGYQLLVWDARGHGKTWPAGSPKGFTFNSFAQDLTALMDHLNITDAVVGGISMGAAVSVRFAICHPSRVRGLVLVRPAWLDEPRPEALRAHPVAAIYLDRYGAETGRQLFEQSCEYQGLRDISAAAAKALCEQFSITDAVERRWRLVGIPNDAPIRSWKEVEVLRMQALVIGNKFDALHPFSYSLAWAEHLPCARMIEVPTKALDFDQHVKAVREHLASMLNSLQLKEERDVLSCEGRVVQRRVDRCH